LASDKTQVFHDQIHAKQKELQPWTAQINSKQAEIDVATSERDALAKKAQALQVASKEAGETLKALKEDLETKVILRFSMNMLDALHLIQRRQNKKSSNMRNEKLRAIFKLRKRRSK